MTPDTQEATAFSSFLLIGGAPVVFSFLFGSGAKTPVYEDGLMGPHGFVRWRR